MKSEEDRNAEADLEARLLSIQKARKAILADRAEPWRRGHLTVVSACDCPVCGGQGTLHYRIAGSNGHIAARCNTPGCASWME